MLLYVLIYQLHTSTPVNMENTILLFDARKTTLLADQDMQKTCRKTTILRKCGYVLGPKGVSTFVLFQTFVDLIFNDSVTILR